MSNTEELPDETFIRLLAGEDFSFLRDLSQGSLRKRKV